jgi:6-phosphogluconolactonase (cycloisomerase 2 family)
LNNGSPSVAGFSLATGLEPIVGSTRALAPDADPGQVAVSPDGRTLVVTERGTNSISTFAVGADGLAEAPQTIASSGATPYGFGFAGGSVVVTEAFGGEAGAAAASSYALENGKLEPVSASIADTRSEVCWAAVTKDGRFAFVTNFGDGTISSYAIGDDGSLDLRDAVAGSARLGEKGIRDEAITRDGRYLYAIDADAQKVFGWTVGSEGELASIGAFGGVPETVAGLAAS